MNINLSLSPAPGIISNWLVVAIYKSTAPTTLVQAQGFAAPHTSPQNITFTGLDDDFYIVITYENTTNTVGGTIRHRFNYDPTWTSVNIRIDLVLLCDGNAGNPTPGNTHFSRADLAGWQYSVERRGFGTLIQGVDINVSNNSQDWDLLTSGDKFGANEYFIVHFAAQIIVQTLPPSNVNLISSTVLVTGVGGDNVLDLNAPGRMHLLQGANPSLIVTLPDLTSIPDNRAIMFLSEGGSHINATLQCLAGQFINTRGGDRSKIYLGNFGEQVWLYKFSGKLRVINPYGNFSSVGQIVYSYSKVDPNTIFADGSEISRAVYPRLFEYVQSLDSSEVVTDTIWNTPDTNGKFINKQKYSLGDGSTTFRIPLLYLTGYLKGVDGTIRKPGSFEYPIIQDHRHEQTIGDLPDDAFGNGPTVRRQGMYNGEGSNRSDLTSSPAQTNGNAFGGSSTAGVTVGDNNSPYNGGVYMLIRI